MKRLIMTAAIAAMIFTTGSMNAQIHKNQSSQQEMAQQQKFKQIKVSQVPNAVSSAVKKNMKNAKIAKAYVNKDKMYKLMLKVKGSRGMKTVYLNKDGEMMKMDNMKSMNKQKSLKNRKSDEMHR